MEALMNTRIFSALLLPAVLTVCVSCAVATPPFASPEDYAVKQKLEAALDNYTRTMTVTVSGGRVYLEGYLEDFQELQDVLEIVRETDGVTGIMEDVQLVQPGSAHDNGNDYK